ncbi:MAG: carbohydrate ABC transporter permease [Chloroflexi bacterium]|nr:carbohydrate ABC transporter permease [Chloroflexota bacterium]
MELAESKPSDLPSQRTLNFRKWWRSFRHQALITLLIIPGAILFIAPFIWMISTALKDPKYVYLFPPQLIPDPVRWDNFYRSLTRLPFHLFAWNTIEITVLCLIGHLFTASLTAYAFARLRFPGRDFLFILLISSIMLPLQVTLIPTFLIYRYLGWIDTFKPLIVPDWLGGTPFTVFLLRQFIATVPYELDEAAKIEGASFFDIYWRIILPLIKPALAAVAIFVFLWNWNDFFYAVIYINSQDNWTLQLGLNYLRRNLTGQTYTEMEILMAASIVVMLPCLLLFFFTQRLFIQGVVFTGVKN